MTYTNTQEIRTAIRNKQIRPGNFYVKPAGAFQIVDLDGSGMVVGHAVEIAYNDSGDAEIIDGIQFPITAVDLIKAQF